ncbi:MAG TPA: hypothetical protein VKG24_33000 [Pseudolabrys sp.]|jgi:hypothetical protein|nr:hypothetical protein [Pseudolabrys sp.]
MAIIATYADSGKARMTNMAAEDDESGSARTPFAPESVSIRSEDGEMHTFQVFWVEPAT